jgi:hypothetical protein
MLTLAIKFGERVRVVTPSGETLWVILGEDLRGRPDRVCLRFDGPRQVQVMREELLLPEECYLKTREIAHAETRTQS